MIEQTEIEILVDDLLAKLKSRGVDAKVTWCLNSLVENARITSFRIDIVGYFH